MANSIRDCVPSTRLATSSETANFFQTPVDALLASLKGKTPERRHGHELLRAYIDLADCMKTYATSIDATAPQNTPALQYLQRHGETIPTCIARDIRLGVMPDTSPQLSDFSDNRRDAYTRPTPDTDERIAQAMQVSAISHHAMKVASCMFAFPALGGTFSSRGLEAILDRLLDILSSKQLHAFNFQKTRALAIWILSTQQLEATIFKHRHQQVSRAIAAVVNDDASSDRMKTDGLKAIYNVFRRHPSLFFLNSVRVFPAVLQYLSSHIPSIRTHAAYALAGITRAALWSQHAECAEADATRWMHVRNSLRQCVQEYSETQCEWSRGDEATLRDLIAAALSTADRLQHCPPDAPWAFSVMGCLTVLAGESFFSTPPLLKMVVRALEAIRTSESPPLFALHASVWRCLVWAFAHLVDAPAPPLSQDPKRSAQADFRERVFATVLQDGRFGVRSALAAVLLEEARREPGGDGVAKAVAVVEELLQRSSVELVVEGVALLRQMMRHAGNSARMIDPPPFDVRDVLPRALLDGTLVDVQSDRIAAVVAQLSPFETDSVRPLTQHEVDAHWDKLLTAWRAALQRVLQEGLKCDDLLEAWKSLLVAKQDSAQAEWTWKQARSSISAVINDFLPQVPTKGRSDLVRLTTARSLWEAACSVLGMDQVRLVADSLMDLTIKCAERILKANSIASTAIQDLLVDILACGSPETWDTFRSGPFDSELCLQIWKATAARWMELSPCRSWEDTVVFLAFPLQYRTVHKDVLSCWAHVFQFTTSSAKEATMSSDMVIETLARHARHITPHPIPSVFIPIFISHLNLQDITTVAPMTLQLVNDFLQSYLIQDTYSPLDVIRLLSNLISRCHAANVVPTLKALSDGLSVWIGAEDNVVPKVDYEEVIVDFYCVMLKRLRETTHEMSEVLRDLEHVLMLPLVNLRSKQSPLALRQFCEGVWKDAQPGSVTFPGSLLLHLAAWYDLTVPRTLHPEFLPEPSQSQSQPEFHQQARPHGEAVVLRSGAEPMASAPPVETPKEQRISSNNRQRHVLNDSSKINEAADTCSVASRKHNSPLAASVNDHHSTISQTRRSLENISIIVSAPTCKKRSFPRDQDDREPTKRRRAIDATDLRDMQEDTDAHVYSTSERVVCTSASPEVSSKPERTALPSPPPTAVAAVAGGVYDPLVSSQTESNLTDAGHCSSPEPEDHRDTKHLFPVHPRTSRPVQVLQQACDAVLADSELPLEDVIAAHRVTAAMQAALADRLKQRLAGKGSLAE